MYNNKIIYNYTTILATNICLKPILTISLQKICIKENYYVPYLVGMDKQKAFSTHSYS